MNEKREKQSLTLTESRFLPMRMETEADEFSRNPDAFCDVELFSHSLPNMNDWYNFFRKRSVLASAVHILKLERYRED